MDDEYLNEFPISDGLDFFIQNPNQTIKMDYGYCFFHLDMVIFILLSKYVYVLPLLII